MAQRTSPDGVFPAEALKALLDQYWESKMRSPLKPPKVPVPGTVFALQPELSSQQAVAVLVSCKAILGYRPSKNVIQKGGYSSKADFIGGLVTEISKEFLSKQSTNEFVKKTQGGTRNETTAI
jgi:hypothetical protein